MVHFPRGTNEGDRSLDARWVEKAKEVKETVANVDLLSEREIARWDLDTDTRRPTGREIDTNWQYDPPLQRANEPGPHNERPDARERPTIRDGDE